MNIQKLSKKERAELMKIVRSHLPADLTFRAIAIECDVSEALVSSFFAGINTNQRVLNYILDELTIEFYESAVPDYLIEKMRENEPAISN